MSEHQGGLYHLVIHEEVESFEDDGWELVETAPSIYDRLGVLMRKVEE